MQLKKKVQLEYFSRIYILLCLSLLNSFQNKPESGCLNELPHMKTNTVHILMAKIRVVIIINFEIKLSALQNPRHEI